MRRYAGLPLVAVLIGATLTSPALAQGGCSHGDRMMHRLDLNGDGAVTEREMDAQATVRFLRWDGDGDGVVTEAEMMAAAQARVAQRIAKRFAKMDANGDGRIEQAEFEAFGADRFAGWDSDGDGKVSAEEMRARAPDRHHGGWWGRHHGVPPKN
jgi:hypothetical protein